MVAHTLHSTLLIMRNDKVGGDFSFVFLPDIFHFVEIIIISWYKSCSDAGI